jgi:hypothetical protein
LPSVSREDYSRLVRENNGTNFLFCFRAGL